MKHLTVRAPALPRKLVAALALLALALEGCSASGGRASTAAETTTSTTTTTTTAPTTTTTVATTTTAKPPPPGLGRGDKGAEVQALEERLAAQGYEVGKVDGVFDVMTGHGVMAFQKVHGLERTSRATDDVTAKLGASEAPSPMLAEGGARRIEIDLKRQVLLLWREGGLERAISISTGNNKRYCVDGECAVAVTPGGSFRVTRRIKGIRVSRLGELYNPLYFNGGIAIHGSKSVPGYPASHGCVRIPMATSEWFFTSVATGTPVYVIGGPKAPVPFNEQAPGDAPPSSTTTSSPPPTSSTTTTSTPTSTTSTTSTTTTTAPPATTPTTRP